jgi:hypothetical protein
MILSVLRHKFITVLILAGCCGFLCQTEAQQSRKMSIVSEVRFDSGDSALNIPFELHNNHIYLQVNVNDSEPLSFILDTAASSTINRKRAESLGLKSNGRDRGFGVGKNAIEAAFVKGVILKVPGVTLSRQTIATVDLEEIQKAEGHTVHGILGSSFLRYFVVEINYAAKIINLYSPETYRYMGKGERVPINLGSGLVSARATIMPLNRPPIQGLFVIDSGGAHDLILYSPFVKRNTLLTEAQTANAVFIGGLGGSSRAVIGVVGTLQIGRSNIENVNTFFSLATSGGMANEKFDGNIGNGLLRRFKVIFDYSRRSMILESVK